MFAGAKKFARDLFTEDDAGTTWCPVRIIAGSMVSLFHAGVIGQLFMHGTFDPVAYAGGASALLVSTGGAIGVKSKMGADRVTSAPMTGPNS